MTWVEVTVTVTDGVSAADAMDILAPFAADGVVVEERLGDPADLDPGALLEQHNVRIYLAPDSEIHPADIDAALEMAGLPAAAYRPLADIDWSVAWRERFEPLRIGRRLIICPTWQDVPSFLSADTLVITLDPGMAFGTGTHETTQLSLRLLEDTIKPGATVLDVGTGSGILAIAAARLGASKVLGIEIDADAARVAAENVMLNDVADRVRIEAGELTAEAGGRWEIVIANIIAPILYELLAGGVLGGAVAPGGSLLLSGILDTQQARMLSVLAELGWASDMQLRQGEWIGLRLRRLE